MFNVLQVEIKKKSTLISSSIVNFGNQNWKLSTKKRSISEYCEYIFFFFDLHVFIQIT